MIGLIQAADRYDPTRRAFRDYAQRRIRGSIIDSFRKLDTYPRRADRTKRLDQYHGWRTDSLELERVVCARSASVQSTRDTLIVVAELLVRLPYRLRCIMRMYYFEAKLDTEIAKVYNLTAARICQLRREAVTLLRAEAERLGLTLNDVL